MVDGPRKLTLRWETLCLGLLERSARFPRSDRFIFGARLDDAALDVAVLLVDARLSNPLHPPPAADTLAATRLPVLGPKARRGPVTAPASLPAPQPAPAMRYAPSSAWMARIGILLFALSAASISTASGQNTELLQTTGRAQIERPAPWLAGWTLDNETLNLNAMPLAPDAPTTILVFFATWCQPCEVGMDILRDNREALQAAGARVLLISVDERDVDVRAWLEARRYPWTTLHDHGHAIARTYGVLRSEDERSSMRLPLTVVLGRDRRVTGIFGTEGQDFLPLLLSLAQQEQHATQSR